VPSRWFRIAYSRNAFVRLLDEEGLRLDSLSVMHGTRAMLTFFQKSKPQHGESDVLEVSWGLSGTTFQFRVTRRMRRHDQPEAQLALVFGFTQAGRTASGTAPLNSWRDVVALEGYHTIRGARPVSRELIQS
jgi:hypothetical protein